MTNRTRSYHLPDRLSAPFAAYLAAHGEKASTVICALIEERLITAGLLEPEPLKEAQP